jgi:hypothetical protein
VLIRDKLNTHHASCFYEHLPLTEAFGPAQQCALRYTAKTASWLNMAELKLSVLARVCLDWHSAIIDALNREIQALVMERNARTIKANSSLA